MNHRLHHIDPRRITLWLAGDVMTGRGNDQIRPQSADPLLHEDSVHDARVYRHLAERVHGSIAAPVNAHYIWGDALQQVLMRQPDAAIVNLETAVTESATAWPGKQVLYRMHPGNLDALQAAGVKVCTLANNHVLDWGERGLRDTLAHLRAAGLASAGAGLDAASAQAPAVVHLHGNRRLLVFAWAVADSGVPAAWRAMVAAAGAEGITLLLISGFRSVQRQQEILERKRAAGEAIESILRVNAAPGYSEHHTGRAVDIGTPGCPPLEERFEETSAYGWLSRNAGRFGFFLSYPRGNPNGIVYEPWHWLHRVGDPG